MKSIQWKEGKVISIELKNKKYVLVQMGPSPYLIIFNLFNNDNDWKQDHVHNNNVLFIHAVTRQFLKNSNVLDQKEIVPAKDVIYKKYWIKEDPSSRKVVIWPETKDEMTFFTLGKNGASLIENGINMSGKLEDKVIIKNIKNSDNKTIDEYELTNISVYPEFNERLLLCSELGKNVDPAKDLIFNRELPLIYKDYFKIISGLIPIKEIGY